MLVAAGSFVFSLVLLFFESNGLVPLGYLIATALSGVVLLLGMRLGHLGGRLVYIHGAADAHKPDAIGQDSKSSDD